MNPVLIAHGLMIDSMTVAAVQAANFQAYHGFIYPVNTAGGQVSITTPPSPVVGQQFAVYDYSKMFDSISALVLRNGSLIMDTADDYEINTKNAFRFFLYSQKGWIVR